MPKIAVAGGSSPFTVGLVDAILVHAADLPRCELALHGRNEAALQLVANYARNALANSGWTVTWSCDLAEAVRESEFVIHQIRYGGLELRRQGERMAAEHQTLADETLGPAALLTAIKTRGALRKTCEVLATAAPNSFVLNLTNPLSVTTSLMKYYGVEKVIGICELPQVTAGLVADCIGTPYARLKWEYTGLNHRGFLHSLTVDDANVLPQLVDRLSGSDLSGVSPTTIAEMGVVPTKYFPLFACTRHHVDSAKPSSRAEFLTKLRSQILEELQRDGTSSPPSLQKRYLEWYPQAVIPILKARYGSKAQRCIVNAVSIDSARPLPITREVHARVGMTRLEFTESRPQSPNAIRWLERFEAHELAVLDGLTNSPTREWIHHVLSLDPTIQENDDALAESIYTQL